MTHTVQAFCILRRVQAGCTTTLPQRCRCAPAAAPSSSVAEYRSVDKLDDKQPGVLKPELADVGLAAARSHVVLHSEQIGCSQHMAAHLPAQWPHGSGTRFHRHMATVLAACSHAATRKVYTTTQGTTSIAAATATPKWRTCAHINASCSRRRSSVCRLNISLQAVGGLEWGAAISV